MVSVCMATYNGELYLKEQVDSILVQLGQDDELVVSDDGSGDKTLEILESYNDPRIKIFINTDRHGVVANFENALFHASGDYIFLSDQDDVWFPDKIKNSVIALSECDGVVNNCLITDGNLQETQGSYFELNHSGKGLFKNLYRSSYLGCCLAFRKELLKTILPIPSSLLLYHDWWIGFFLELSCKVKFIDSPSMYFRRHDHNVTMTTKNSILPFNKKIYYRLQLLGLCTLRILKLI